MGTGAFERFAPPRLGLGSENEQSSEAPSWCTSAEKKEGVPYQPYVVGTSIDLQELGAGGPANDGPLDATDSGTSEQAKQEAEAHNAGFAEGFAAGQAAAAADAEDKLNQLAESLKALHGFRSSLFDSYRQELLELAIQVAESLIRKKIEDGENLIEGLVQEALSTLNTEEELILSVGPNDEQKHAEWLEDMRQIGAGIKVQIDPQLQEGDIRIRCESGSIEMLYRERIERVRNLLLGSPSQ